jgi:hypothetical protein
VISPEIGYFSFVVYLRCAEDSEDWLTLCISSATSGSALRYFDHEEMGSKRHSRDKLARSQIYARVMRHVVAHLMGVLRKYAALHGSRMQAA